MIGQGALLECIADPGVGAVLCIGRSKTPVAHVKVRQLQLPDVSDLSSVIGEVTGFGACFFCLGVSSVGMTEEKYRSLTYDLTLRAARTLAERNPGMAFIYVSGVGTDSTEHGRVMWARVKGATENALLKLPFNAAYMFRPGIIVPVHGVTSRTPLYRFVYAISGPLVPLLRTLFPNQVSTTERTGRAMIVCARDGAPKLLLEPTDIEALVRSRE